jgi:hypothetical protein
MGWVKKEKFAWSLDPSYQTVDREEEGDDDEAQEDWVEQARITGEDAWADYDDVDDDDGCDGDGTNGNNQELLDKLGSFENSNIGINGRADMDYDQHNSYIERRSLAGNGTSQDGHYGTNSTVGDARSH